MTTRVINSFDSSNHSWLIDAPNTLRTPISLVRCSATKDAKPNDKDNVVDADFEDVKEDKEKSA